MDILVCVKQVPDDFVEVRLDPATQLPATAEIERVANAFDTYAVELAVRYCEANGGTVTAACIGGESAKNTLKNLIAVGVNKAYLFNDEGLAAGDESAKAGYLAQVIKTCEEKSGTTYGLILCGKESTDEISGQVGAILAEKTGLPFVSSVIEVAPNGRRPRMASPPTRRLPPLCSPLPSPAMIPVIPPSRARWLPARRRSPCSALPTPA